VKALNTWYMVFMFRESNIINFLILTIAPKIKRSVLVKIYLKIEEYSQSTTLFDTYYLKKKVSYK